MDNNELKIELERRFPWLLDKPLSENARSAWELRAIFTLDEVHKWYQSLGGQWPPGERL